MFDSRAWNKLGGERLSSPRTTLLSVTDCNALAVALRQEPIIRVYKPEFAAVDELVEALHRLLMDAATETPAIVPAQPDSGCFRFTPE